MNKKLKSFFIPGRRFKSEFRRQVRMLVIVTLGFTIAFTWRQTIFDISKSFVKFILHIDSSSALSILASILITIISIILIYLTSHYLKESPRNY